MLHWLVLQITPGGRNLGWGENPLFLPPPPPTPWGAISVYENGSVAPFKSVRLCLVPKKFWTEAVLSQEVLFKTAIGRCLFLGGRARGQMEKQQLLSHQFGFVWYQKGSGPEPLFHPWGLINFEEGLF